MIFLSSSTSSGLDTLISAITFGVPSDLFLNQSISSISLISLLLCSFTSTRGFTGKLIELGPRSVTYLVGVRTGASISGTG